LDEIEVVERGYRAVAAGDREALTAVFAEGAAWRLMDRTRVRRTHEGRAAVVEFLMGFKRLQLESIMLHGEYVVAAHSFAMGARRGVATTMYTVRDGLVVAAECADVLRRVRVTNPEAIVRVTNPEAIVDR
jgi:ketosteroid isomerase-like protein